MLDKKVVIAGYSGHAYVVAEAAMLSGVKLTHYSEMKQQKLNPYDLIYLGYEEDPSFFEKNKYVEFLLGIGSNKIRCKVFDLLIKKNIEVANVVHPSSIISSSITIGKGNFISNNTSINPLVTIEDACIINTGAIVEHECLIKTGAHLAPSSVLAGNVVVGEQSFIGANSVVKEGVIIGNNVLIGAGSVVIKDVPDGAKIVGNPARKI